MKRKPLLIILTFNMVLSMQLLGQTKFDLEVYTYEGSEYNIFKNPMVLLDLNTNEYVEKDSFIISDNFLDLGYDSKYQIKKKKDYYFEVGSDFRYRKYSNYTNVNQKILSANTLFEKNLSKKSIVGFGYTFLWKDKLGTSFSGDELLRSFKYFGNAFDIYFDYSPSKKLNFLLKNSYLHKNYYDDNTDMPLNNSNINIVFGADYQADNIHGVSFDFDYTNRQYKYYAASNNIGDKVVTYDSLGVPIPGYQLQHFQYYAFGISYIFKPFKGFVITPKFDFLTRNDTYQGYYNYSTIYPKLKIRFMNKKWYASLETAYKKIDYNKKYAYTFIQSSELLEYNYLKYNIKLRYKIFNSVELFVNYTSDNRNSNTELEDVRTRRSYNNSEILFGLNVVVFDYNSKYDKKN